MCEAMQRSVAIREGQAIINKHCRLFPRNLSKEIRNKPRFGLFKIYGILRLEFSNLEEWALRFCFCRRPVGISTTGRSEFYVYHLKGVAVYML